jgi:hypothetical protein
VPITKKDTLFIELGELSKVIFRLGKKGYQTPSALKFKVFDTKVVK